MTDNNEFPTDPRDLTEEQRKKIKIEFAPGCFDNFEGTQEELDELLAEIRGMIESGELFTEARHLDMNELMEEDPEFAMHLMERIGAATREEYEEDRKRNLN